ncbi:signal peptidase I [Marinithermus hydrothermalis]|nr:signal peptidase I [Marinithermus hydrothermalis]
MREFFVYLWREWFRQVGEALLIAFVVTTFGFTTVAVFGSSMQPTLAHGERVFVPKYEAWAVRFGLTEWRRGDIAILKPPQGAPNSVTAFPVLGFTFRPFFIKRIVGLPGDVVSVRRGVVYVNGQPLDEEHITRFITPYPDSFPRVEVRRGRVVRFAGIPVDRLPEYLKPALEMLEPLPEEVIAASQARTVEYVGSLRLKEGYYFVLGDNRSLGGSEDSRTFGPVPARNIAGRATFVWWPLVRRDEEGWRVNVRRLEVPQAFLSVPPAPESR